MQLTKTDNEGHLVFPILMITDRNLSHPLEVYDRPVVSRWYERDGAIHIQIRIFFFEPAVEIVQDLHLLRCEIRRGLSVDVQRRLNIRMTKDRLDRFQVQSGFTHSRCKCMAQPMIREVGKKNRIRLILIQSLEVAIPDDPIKRTV